jgi:large subunit ribosomal protein L11
MGKESVDVLIEGGKATAAPPLGPALGPMGVNIGQVVAEINKKTADFKGMKVPVKVIIDSDTKLFEIKIGTPPASQLIKKEANIKKGASNPKAEKVADLKIEQIIKIANMKKDSLLGKDNLGRVLEIMGTCQSAGVMVEGKPAHDTIVDIKENGAFKEKIASGKTELSAEELKELEVEKKKLQEEIAANRKVFEATAKGILSQLDGKDNKVIRKAMEEAGVPMLIINELAPAADKKDAAAAK